MTTALVPFEHQRTLAEAFAKSGLFGIRTAEQALTLMAVCEAEGLHPAIAVRDFHIINGKPSLKADAMLARFQAAGGKVEWPVYTDQKVVGVFSHPHGGSVEIDWTIDRAKTAGLTGKDVWKAYPRQMLRARCISEGIRTVYPQATGGMYVPEEVQAFAKSERDIPREEKDVTPPRSEPPARRGRPPKTDAAPIEGEVMPSTAAAPNNVTVDQALDLINTAHDMLQLKGALTLANSLRRDMPEGVDREQFGADIAAAKEKRKAALEQGAQA